MNSRGIAWSCQANSVLGPSNSPPHNSISMFEGQCEVPYKATSANLKAAVWSNVKPTESFYREQVVRRKRDVNPGVWDRLHGPWIVGRVSSVNLQLGFRATWEF